MTADPYAARSETDTSAHTDAAHRPYREVTDANGRVYRIGETDRDILGHSRKLMVYLPWIAMMAISVFEYAYGSAEDTLSHAHGWTQSNTFWILSVWVFFQAGIAFPAGWLREKGILTARRAMYIGSGMCLVGFLALSHLDNVWLAILRLRRRRGLGAGLVYATCINMVGKWFPERRGREDRIRQRRLRVRIAAVHLHLQLRVRHRELPPGAGPHRLLHPGRGRRVRVLLQGPAEELVARGHRPADASAATRRARRASPRTRRRCEQYTPKEAIRTGMLPLMWFRSS